MFHQKSVKFHLPFGIALHIDDYKKFVMEQVSYARELDKIKHLMLE